jgi:hypothetical protein
MQPAARHALVIPGARGGPRSLLLVYAAEAAERRGATIHRLTWPPEPDPFDLTTAEAPAFVLPPVQRALDEIPHPRPLLVAISLGTHAAALAAERDLPAVWLTPLLTEAPVLAALRAATAPFLLVGGTDDPVWDADLAATLTPHVLSVEGADHAMFVRRPLAGTSVLAQLAIAVDTFVGQKIWP